MSKGRRIAVFGRADLQPGTPDYLDAMELGRLIALEGWSVLTGGYGGAMYAVSLGAARAAMYHFEMGSGLWALWKSRFLPPRILVLVGPAWGPIMDGLMGPGALEKNLLEWTARAEGNGPALGALRGALREGSLDGQVQR